MASIAPLGLSPPVLEEVPAGQVCLEFDLEDSRCVGGALTLDSSRQELERWQTGHLGKKGSFNCLVLRQQEVLRVWEWLWGRDFPR